MKAELSAARCNGIIRNESVTDLPQTQPERRSGLAANYRVLRMIAAFKLFKGLVLFAVGMGAAKLLHKDLAFEVERWADIFRVDPNNHYFRRLLEKFLTFDDRKLRELSVGTFFYSALLLTEGTGLLLRKRWAEYFTIIVTSSFLPLEVYELTKRISAPRIILLLLNAAIVIYLGVQVRRGRQMDAAQSESSALDNNQSRR
jgi:uncharacterized membrane protein (DUF2068 family)